MTCSGDLRTMEPIPTSTWTSSHRTMLPDATRNSTELSKKCYDSCRRSHSHCPTSIIGQYWLRDRCRREELGCEDGGASHRRSSLISSFNSQTTNAAS